MENVHPNRRTLQELRRAVARYGVNAELPDPELGHCDDCHGFGAVFPLGPGRRCLACWLRRQRARQRLAATGDAG